MNKCDYPSLSVSESYFDLTRIPDKNQIFGNAVEYLYNFIDWCFFKPQKNACWTRQTRYCYKIKGDCKKCKFIEDKAKCNVKKYMNRLIKYGEKHGIREID